MSKEIMRALLDTVESYQTVFLFRHTRMDGDCAGASKGLKEILRASYPDKTVLLVDAQQSDFLAFLGPDDSPAPDEAYRDALAIVVDTADRERISNKKYALCREIIKIDHHIEVDVYGDLNWVEPERSSACEMIAALYWENRDRLIMTRQAATYVYLGMVTDSGRFRFSGVNGETMRLAGMLLDQGIDTETLYAQLYLHSYETLKFRAYVYDRMERTENGVAYIFVSREMQRAYGLNFEAASNVIAYLENIRGCLCWLAFIETEPPEEGIRVRLRSRFMTVNEIANLHHGGGHANASGATVYSREEMQALIREADEAVKAFKKNNTGWM
ncbi:MAG: bifunctional oligoribonuclease/PAP phosphatase NrnA [Clostridia bacterium]|nr:bifunctional oligoribonuclease/PAP phosphatase NrnA [Clostridia bacterium]